jgi:hypothetical protein
MNPDSYNKHLLFAGLLFTIHNTEEAIGTASFLLPQAINLPIALPRPVSMIAVVITITVMAWCLLFWAVRHNNVAAKRNVLMLSMFIFLLNAFFPHIIAAIVLRCYVPGVVTAVVLYLPYSLWAAPKLFLQFENKKQLYRLLWIGILVTVVIVIGLQWVASLIFS